MSDIMNNTTGIEQFKKFIKDIRSFRADKQIIEYLNSNAFIEYIPLYVNKIEEYWLESFFKFLGAHANIHMVDALKYILVNINNSNKMFILIESFNNNLTYLDAATLNNKFEIFFKDNQDDEIFNKIVEILFKHEGISSKQIINIFKSHNYETWKCYILFLAKYINESDLSLLNNRHDILAERCFVDLQIKWNQRVMFKFPLDKDLEVTHYHTLYSKNQVIKNTLFTIINSIPINPNGYELSDTNTELAEFRKKENMIYKIIRNLNTKQTCDETSRLLLEIVSCYKYNFLQKFRMLLASNTISLEAVINNIDIIKMIITKYDNGISFDDAMEYYIRTGIRTFDNNISFIIMTTFFTNIDCEINKQHKEKQSKFTNFLVDNQPSFITHFFPKKQLNLNEDEITKKYSDILERLIENWPTNTLRRIFWKRLAKFPNLLETVFKFPYCPRVYKDTISSSLLILLVYQENISLLKKYRKWIYVEQPFTPKYPVEHLISNKYSILCEFIQTKITQENRLEYYDFLLDHQWNPYRISPSGKPIISKKVVPDDLPFIDNIFYYPENNIADGNGWSIVLAMEKGIIPKNPEEIIEYCNYDPVIENSFNKYIYKHFTKHLKILPLPIYQEISKYYYPILE